MNQTKTSSPFYLLSLSNMLDLIPGTSVHSSSLLYFDGTRTYLYASAPLLWWVPMWEFLVPVKPSKLHWSRQMIPQVQIKTKLQTRLTSPGFQAQRPNGTHIRTYTWRFKNKQSRILTWFALLICFLRPANAIAESGWNCWMRISSFSICAKSENANTNYYK